jgi:hypothetical protein
VRNGKYFAGFIVGLAISRSLRLRKKPNILKENRVRVETAFFSLNGSFLYRTFPYGLGLHPPTGSSSELFILPLEPR